MPANVTILLEGLPELQRKLKGPPRIYSKPVSKALRNLAKVGAETLRNRSTRLTGRLAKSIRPRTRGAALWSAVAFNPIGSQARGKGADFRSAWAFDNSTMFKPRSGGMTTGWIRQTPPLLAGPAQSFINTAAKEIEQDWSS